MAATGSRKWMLYTADDGSLYAQKNKDESVGNATGFQDVAAAGPNPEYDLFPKYFKPRRLNVFAVVGGVTVRRTFPIGTEAAFEAAIDAGTITVDGQAWTVSSSRGEESAIVYGADTEVTDGTAD